MKKLVGIALLLIGLATSAVAYDCSKPEAFTTSVSVDVLKILAEKALDSKQKQAKVTGIFNQVVDTGWMAKFILAQKWQELTPAQQSQFTALYGEFIATSYIPKIDAYTGYEKVTVKDAKQLNEGFFVNVVVKTESDEDEFAILLRNVDGCFKVNDIIVEGVSIIKTERQEFGAVLQAQGFEALIKILEGKIAQNKAQ